MGALTKTRDTIAYAGVVTDLVVETPEGLTLRFGIAGAGSRSAAALVDLFLWGAALFAALFFFQVVLGGLGGFAIWIGAGTILSLVSYHAGFSVLWHGQTPGKRLMGIAVFDENGLGATPPAAHPALALLAGGGLPARAGPARRPDLMMAATPHHQRLGDRVAGTLVLRSSRQRQPSDPLRRIAWSQLPNRRLELVPALAARFDGDDVAFLGELLGRVGVEPAARGRLFRRAVGALCGAPRAGSRTAPGVARGTRALSWRSSSCSCARCAGAPRER